MYEQINSQFLNLTRQFADSALKANTLAFENFERLVSLHLKTVESRVNASVEFLGEASDVRDLDGIKEIWPKGVNLMRESAEELIAAQQESMGQTLKATEAMAELVKGNFAAANEGAAKVAKKAKSAAAK